jgi:hypothetical protein
MSNLATDRPPDVSDPLVARLVGTWQSRVGPVRVCPDGDWENWVECALRLQAAMDIVGADHVLVDDQPARADTLELGVVLGPHSPSATRSAAIAERYMHLRTFAERAGQSFVLSTTRRAPGAVAAMKALSADGCAFVKTCESKMLAVTVGPDQTLDDAVDASGDPYTLIRATRGCRTR